MKPDAFRDKVAIVTGASSGIGRALGLQLAVRGARVVLAARRLELLEQAAGECRALGGQALAVPTDVTSEEACKVLVERTVSAFGTLDLLINNAGLAVITRLEDLPDLSLFKYTMEVNFYGAVHCTYFALPYLICSRGRIVGVSSLGGKAALPYNSPYIASKFAMQGFFDSLRMEMKPHGVSVTTVCPSWVVSGFHEAQLDKDGVAVGPRGRAVYSKSTMSAGRCAAIILRAAEKRRREVLMSPGRLAAWLNVISPGLLDWMAVNLFLKPAIQRTRKETENDPA